MVLVPLDFIKGGKQEMNKFVNYVRSKIKRISI